MFMRKYTLDLLKGFLKICQNQANKTGLKRIGLGIAIIIEGGITPKLKEGNGYSTDSPANSEISAAFREMIENGWINEEKNLSDDDKYNYFFDYQDYITKTVY